MQFRVKAPLTFALTANVAGGASGGDVAQVHPDGGSNDGAASSGRLSDGRDV